MAKQLSDIKKLIERGETDTAINALTNFIGNHQGSKDEAYYLLGNAYRKKGDWQQALNNYLEAIERNPESPAVQAHTMLMQPPFLPRGFGKDVSRYPCLAQPKYVPLASVR